MDRIFHHDDTMYEAATKVYVKTDGYAYSDRFPVFPSNLSSFR